MEGDLGDDTGLDMEDERGLRGTLGLGATPAPAFRGSFSGTTCRPRVEPPLAELTPLMAETEFRSPSLKYDQLL